MMSLRTCLIDKKGQEMGLGLSFALLSQTLNVVFKHEQIESSEEAIIALRQAKSCNHPYDLIFIDMHFEKDNPFADKRPCSGIDLLARILEDDGLFDEKTQYFVYTNDPNRAADYIDETYPHLKDKMPCMCKLELFEVADALKTNTNSLRSIEENSTYVFHEYLNQKLGSNLPVPKKEHLHSMKALTLEKALERLANGTLKQNEFFERVMDQNIDNAFNTQLSEKTCRDNMFFRQGAGATMTGYAAYSQKDVLSLKDRGLAPIFINTEKEDPDLDLLYDCKGYISIEPDSNHLPITLKNAGITSVFGSDLSFKKIESGEALTIEIYNTPSKKSALGRVHFHHHDLKKLNLDDHKTVIRPILDEMQRERSDEHGMKLYASVETPQKIFESAQYGASGAGLVRTEKLMRNSAQKDYYNQFILDSHYFFKKNKAQKEFQHNQYHHLSTLIASAAETDRNSPYTMNIRLLDAPASEYFTPKELAKFTRRYNEPDLRGTRLLLRHPKLLHTQLDALFEAVKPYESYAKQKISVILPYVSSPDEMKEAQKLIQDRFAHHGFWGRLNIGIMAETVPAVQHIAEFMPYTDLILYGTNDYTAERLKAPRFKRKQLEEWMQNNKDLCKQDIGPLNPYEHLSPVIRNDLQRSVTSVRKVNPYATTIICGEHVNTDKSSLNFAYVEGFSGVCVPGSTEYLFKSAMHMHRAASSYKDHRLKNLKMA